MNSSLQAYRPPQHITDYLNLYALETLGPMVPAMLNKTSILANTDDTHAMVPHAQLIVMQSCTMRTVSGKLIVSRRRLSFSLTQK